MDNKTDIRTPLENLLISRKIEGINDNPIREITKEEMLNRLAAYIIAYAEVSRDGCEMAALFKVYFDNC